MDRLLIAGLIEARSCERFDLLRQHVQDKELAEFYGSLFESEARHHTTYVRLQSSSIPIKPYEVVWLNSLQKKQKSSRSATRYRECTASDYPKIIGNRS